MLAAHEQATGEQVVVVTVPSLQGLTDRGFRLSARPRLAASAKKERTTAS